MQPGRNLRKVVIAGAGCAGLAAGIALRRAGCQVTILEASDRVGGLAGGIEINGNIYEYGPHIFHTVDPEILKIVHEIAGHVLLPFEKTIKIKFLGKYFDFPLSIPDVLLKLPITTVLAAIGSLFKYSILGLFEGKDSLVNSEKVLQRYYGDVLYRIFFKDYIDKVWGMPPTAMAASFAQQRIPRFDLVDFIARIRKKFFRHEEKITSDNYVEKVEGDPFTTEKGFALIAEAFASKFIEEGGDLRLNAPVVAVKTKDHRIESVSFHTHSGTTEGLPCDSFVSTIPINVLPRLISPPMPTEVITAASQLKYRALLLVGLLVRRDKALPASFMYFRDKSFNRITDLGQFKVKIKPAGCTILIAEIACQPEDEYWDNETLTKKTVIEELCAEGLIKADEVLEAHIFKTEYGYPIYTVGYETALQTILDGLKSYHGLHSTGRQGRFAYINTHIAMKMGFEAARQVSKELSSQSK